jgi:hypothetical protein
MAITSKDFSEQLDNLGKLIDDLVKVTAGVAVSDLKKWYDQFKEELPVDASGKLDAAAFDKYDATRNQYFQDRLNHLQEAAAKYHDGPAKPSSIMYKEYASNWAIWLLALGVLSVTVTLLAVIWSYWPDATRGTNPCPGGLRAGMNLALKPSEQPAPKSPEASKPADQNKPATPADQTKPDASNKAVTTDTKPSDASEAKPAPHVVPRTITLTTCQIQPFQLEPDKQPSVKWDDPATGFISADGQYQAPTSLAASQTIKITAHWTGPDQKEQTSYASVELVPPGGPDEVYVVLMVILMGALGGAIHWISSLAIFVGNRQLYRSWVMYYALMPVEGAALAIIVFMLLKVGILSPTMANGSQSGTAGLNIIGIYAFAGMTGLFSKQALASLADVFNAIFKKVEAKDQPKTGDSKAAGTTTTTTTTK